MRGVIMPYYCKRFTDDDFRIYFIPNHYKVNNNLVNKTGITSDEEVIRISTSRAFHKINELIRSNPDFKYFFTCTCASSSCDRFSLTETQSYIRKLMKKIKRTHKDFKYLFITEEHTNGAFHFHGVCSDLPLYVNDNGYFSNSVFDELGFNSFSVIKDLTACSFYITKYVTKSMIKTYGGHSYFRSRNLKTADIERIYPINLTLFDLPQYDFKNKKMYNKKEGTTYFSNDYCQILDFRPSKMNKDQLNYIRMTIN